jgi:hypothetical protein
VPVARLAGLAREDLERRLATERLLRSRRRQRRDGRDASGDQPLALLAPGARDQAQVVHRAPATHALALEVAHGAVRDRLGERVRLHHGLHAPHDAPVQRGDARQIDRLEPAVAEDHGRRVRAGQARVQRELVDLRRLHRARELRVDHLVAAPDRAQEVRPAHPAPVEERRLVDQRRSGPHRRRRPPRRRLERGAVADVEVLRQVDRAVDPQPLLRLELVGVAAAADQLRVRVRGGVRPRAGEPPLLEVGAGEVGRDVGRGEDERAVVEREHR